jgi:hypothetical protein
MTEWERLTPKDNPPERDIHYYCLDSFGEHAIGTGFPHSDGPESWRDDHSYLNDAELLALARKSPEVQVLAEIKIGRLIYACRQHLYSDAPHAQIEAALRKFEAA